MENNQEFRKGLATDLEIAIQHYMDVLFGLEETAPSYLKAIVSINLNNEVYVSFSVKGRHKRYESMTDLERANIFFASQFAGAIVRLRNRIKEMGPSKVSEVTEISRAHIYKIINMESSPTLDVLLSITRALDEYEYLEAIENDELPEIQIFSNTFKFDFK